MQGNSFDLPTNILYQIVFVCLIIYLHHSLIFLFQIKQEVNERKDGSGAHNSMSHHASSGSVQVNREHLNQSQFYLIGDSTIKELTPIFSAAANVTVLWKEGLTYATLPKFAETHVNLDTAGQIYLVCFVGILDLIEVIFLILFRSTIVCKK